MLLSKTGRANDTLLHAMKYIENKSHVKNVDVYDGDDL